MIECTGRTLSAGLVTIAAASSQGAIGNDRAVLMATTVGAAQVALAVVRTGRGASAVALDIALGVTGARKVAVTTTREVAGGGRADAATGFAVASNVARGVLQALQVAAVST